jgi:hypothetical protein
MSTTTLHDRDFLAWTAEQAGLLRSGKLTAVDVENLAEEIEDMGKEQRNAVRSFLRMLLVHLLKLSFSDSTDPRPGWIEEVAEFRAQLFDRLDDSPSLRPQLDGLFAEAWPKARTLAQTSMKAHGESKALPADNPFTLRQVLDESFFGLR